MTQPLPPTINPLDYAPDAMPLMIRRRRRRIILVLAIVALLGFAWFNRQPISVRARQLYWAQRCARFTVPDDTPRVAMLPSDLAKASGDPNYQKPSTIGYTSAPLNRLLFQPVPWREFAALAANRPYHFFDDNTLFLHELRTPSGKRRIVHLECLSQNMLAPARHLVPTIIEPPTLFHPPRVIYEPTGSYAISERYVPGRLFIGQPDPADRSHFTIRFQAVPTGRRSSPDRSGIIDGYLGDDDRITYRIRDPATTQGL